MVSKRFLATLAIACGVATPSHADSFDTWALAQLTAESLADDDALSFGADLIRAGIEASSGDFSAKLQIDLGAGDLDERRPGTLPNVVTDLFVTYAIDGRNAIVFGQHKVPLGYDYMRPGHDLDLAKRGMEKGLVLDRTIGVSLQGRRFASGFGYDLGLYNLTGRSSATRQIGSGAADQSGDDLAAAARVFFAPDEHWHAELAVGTSEQAGGPDTENYNVIDAALRWRNGPLTLLGEFIAGADVRGIAGRDEQVWYAHAGYDFSPRLTGVVRHYAGTSDVAGNETDLGNTWIGMTWHLDQQRRTNSRLMINYVFASGDQASYTGVRGYRDDALLAQFQFHYRSD